MPNLLDDPIIQNLLAANTANPAAKTEIVQGSDKKLRNAPSSQEYKYIDSLSRNLRDQQAEHTARLLSENPQLKDVLKIANLDKTFKNTNIDAYVAGVTKQLGIDPYIEATPEYLKTAKEYDDFTTKYGFGFNLLGQKEGETLSKFGMRNMFQKNIHDEKENAYKILDDNEE